MNKMYSWTILRVCIRRFLHEFKFALMRGTQHINFNMYWFAQNLTLIYLVSLNDLSSHVVCN